MILGTQMEEGAGLCRHRRRQSHWLVERQNPRGREVRSTRIRGGANKYGHTKRAARGCKRPKP